MFPDKDGCKCFDETTRKCTVCISFFDKKGCSKRRVKKKKSYRERRKCDCCWHRRMNYSHSWASVCCKCGGFARGPR